MRAERTFWEKATAIHVFCAQGSFRGRERFARHWHDVARLDAAGFVDAAVADIGLGKAVADHKSIFFAEKSPQGELIDYHAAVSGGLQLVPGDSALAVLASDYQHMVDDGLFLDDVESFDTLLQRCRVVEEKANAPSSLQSIVTGELLRPVRPGWLSLAQLPMADADFLQERQPVVSDENADLSALKEKK